MRQMMICSSDHCKRALVCIFNSFPPRVRAKNAITTKYTIVTAAEHYCFSDLLNNLQIIYSAHYISVLHLEKNIWLLSGNFEGYLSSNSPIRMHLADWKTNDKRINDKNSMRIVVKFDFLLFTLHKMTRAAEQ